MELCAELYLQNVCTHSVYRSNYSTSGWIMRSLPAAHGNRRGEPHSYVSEGYLLANPKLTCTASDLRPLYIRWRLTKSSSHKIITLVERTADDLLTKVSRTDSVGRVSRRSLRNVVLLCCSIGQSLIFNEYALKKKTSSDSKIFSIHKLAIHMR